MAIAPHKARNSADRIVGIETLGEQLLVSTNEYYDANANNKENLVVFANRRDLKSGEQYGFYSFSGRSHAAGWMGKLPTNWLQYLAIHIMLARLVISP